MKDFRLALDRVEEEFSGTLERILKIISEPDKISKNQKEELEVQTALAIDKYRKISILDKEVLQSFVHYRVLPIFLNPGKESRVFANKPYEWNFNIEYSVINSDPKNKNRSGIHGNPPNIVIPFNNSILKDTNSVTDYQYTLDQIVKQENIKNPKQVLFQDDGILYKFNKGRWKKIKIDKSYFEIKPNYTNKFKNSNLYHNFNYISSITYRIKKPMSFIKKLYDDATSIDKIPEFLFKDINLDDAKVFTKFQWDNLIEEYNERKKANTEKGDNPEIPDNPLPNYDNEITEYNKLKNKHFAIADTKAMRFITPERRYALEILNTIASKVFGQEDLEDYYTLNESFNRDRLESTTNGFVLDGFIQFKPYCIERNTRKPNGYESYQGDIRYSGRLIEVQSRSQSMHEINECGNADHEKFKQLKEIRRACHMSAYPEYKAKYDLLKDIFNNI
jgi:hypothetical protein